MEKSEGNENSLNLQRTCNECRQKLTNGKRVLRLSEFSTLTSSDIKWVSLSKKFIPVFQFVSLSVLTPNETLELGRNASRCLNPFLDFVSFFLLCLRRFVFSAALRNFTTGPSPWSNRMTVPLLFLICLYYSNYFLVV